MKQVFINNLINCLLRIFSSCGQTVNRPGDIVVGQKASWEPVYYPTVLKNSSFFKSQKTGKFSQSVFSPFGFNSLGDLSDNPITQVSHPSGRQSHFTGFFPRKINAFNSFQNLLLEGGGWLFYLHRLKRNFVFIFSW